jgi:hypothetical protein
MEQKEMLALLKSQMHMTYAERNEIAVHMNALSERLHQQEADIEKLVQESGTMKASSPTMEWIRVEDRLPKLFDKVLVYSKREGVDVDWYTDLGYFTPGWKTGDISHWMPLPEPPKQKEPTFKDVFLGKFPKVKLLDGGTPVVCAKGVFPQIGDYDECCNAICRECWNQPYFEPEEEGGE